MTPFTGTLKPLSLRSCWTRVTVPPAFARVRTVAARLGDAGLGDPGLGDDRRQWNEARCRDEGNVEDQYILQSHAPSPATNRARRPRTRGGRAVQLNAVMGGKLHAKGSTLWKRSMNGLASGRAACPGPPPSLSRARTSRRVSRPQNGPIRSLRGARRCRPQVRRSCRNRPPNGSLIVLSLLTISCPRHPEHRGLGSDRRERGQHGRTTSSCGCAWGTPGHRRRFISGRISQPGGRVQRREGAEHAADVEVAAVAQRREWVKALIDQQIDDAKWQELLHQARQAAEQGEKEYLLLRFPSALCTDDARAINNQPNIGLARDPSG